MSEDVSPAISIAIEIDDPALADRLASLLGGVAGLSLVAPGQPADVAIVSRERRNEAPEVELTPRELDVLALMAEGASNKAIAKTARHFRPHRQVPCRLDPGQARCHRPNRCGRACGAARRHPPVRTNEGPCDEPAWRNKATFGAIRGRDKPPFFPIVKATIPGRNRQNIGTGNVPAVAEAVK